MESLQIGMEILTLHNSLCPLNRERKERSGRARTHTHRERVIMEYAPSSRRVKHDSRGAFINPPPFSSSTVHTIYNGRQHYPSSPDPREPLKKLKYRNHHHHHYISLFLFHFPFQTRTTPLAASHNFTLKYLDRVLLTSRPDVSTLPITPAHIT